MLRTTISAEDAVYVGAVLARDKAGRDPKRIASSLIAGKHRSHIKIAILFGRRADPDESRLSST